MRLHFGIHAGRDIETIDIEYLEWVLDSLRKIRPSLRAAIESEVQRRRQSQQGTTHSRPQREPPPPRPHPQDQRGTLAAVVKRGFAALALKYHADRGGTDREMMVVNAAQDTILAALRAENLIN